MAMLGYRESVGLEWISTGGAQSAGLEGGAGSKVLV
jgi:hypothetical protein